jgi:spore cortex formation protein SpoVR/YcgB (stage V sporulation)
MSWTFAKLESITKIIEDLAVEKYGLDFYPNQIEVVSSEQMLDAYASVGMPINYHHWSFGKSFISNQKLYQEGRQGLAYEMVINSNPCISYCMEQNSMMMMALVICHAAVGHNGFFKNNFLFQQHTDADAIIPYLSFAKSYIRDCEEKHGVKAVEDILDSAHALQNYGVNRYQKISLDAEDVQQEERLDLVQRQARQLWQKLIEQPEEEEEERRFPEHPEENILYFIEKNAPMLEPWQREVVRIVRKVSSYLYPQGLTKVANEGYACFWHYTLMKDLYEMGHLSDSDWLEFIESHTAVTMQLDHDHPYYNGINPYALGFQIFMDIRRMCEDPTEEDKEWFPNLRPWTEEIDYAMRNFKDETFIHQYLSPKVMRDMKLFAIMDDDKNDHYEVSAIHNERGYKHVREALANQYGARSPELEVYEVDIAGDRLLTINHNVVNRQPLGDDTQECLKHLHRLWGFDVEIVATSADGGPTESVYYEGD